MSEPVFKVEDRGGGYRFISAPEFPGFTGMLKPGELGPTDDHIRDLIMLVALDTRAAEHYRLRNLTPEQVEPFAIRAAKGNNGGEWATHYTEDQKNVWRQFVRDLVASLAETH